MELLRALSQFEKNFIGYPVLDFAYRHSDLPVFAVCLYLGFVFAVPDLLKNRKPFSLKWALAMWNLGLSVFSIIGCTRTVPVLYTAWRTHGIRYTCCENPENWYINGPVALWMGLFIFSKYPELLDTVFLVLEKKPVIFLHWFHHTTVLLYCWHAFINRVAPGLWFASMNYCVHSGMYMYYFLMSVGFRKVTKKIAPLVTLAQLLQMVVGCAVTSMSAYYHTQDPESCFVNPANFRLGLGMYASYWLLFAVLFRNLYCVGSGNGAKTERTEAAKRKDPMTCCGVELKGGDGAGFFHPAEETSKNK